MAVYWLAGTPPVKTSVSVPRLMPVYRVRTSTSPSSGSRRVTGRISPAPGSRTQNALAASVIGTSRDREPFRRSARSTRSGPHSDGGTVPAVRTGPLIGLAGQVVLVTLLAGTAGLGPAG